MAIKKVFSITIKALIAQIKCMIITGLLPNCHQFKEMVCASCSPGVCARVCMPLENSDVPRGPPVQLVFLCLSEKLQMLRHFASGQSKHLIIISRLARVSVTGGNIWSSITQCSQEGARHQMVK